MRAPNVGPSPRLQIIEDLDIGHALVNATTDLVGHATGIDVAAGLDIEPPGRAVAADATAAVNRGEEPVDPFLFLTEPSNISRAIGLLNFQGRLGNLKLNPLSQDEILLIDVEIRSARVVLNSHPDPVRHRSRRA